jgi:hypothetical protein
VIPCSRATSARLRGPAPSKPYLCKRIASASGNPETFLPIELTRSHRRLEGAEAEQDRGLVVDDEGVAAERAEDEGARSPRRARFLDERVDLAVGQRRRAGDLRGVMELLERAERVLSPHGGPPFHVKPLG